jgi:UPF0042 nucleotide-binding protein
MRFVIITGMSGAGKSQVVKNMEDLGFFCVDNMPPALLSKFAEISAHSTSKMEKVALVMDIRGGEMLAGLFPEIDAIKNNGLLFEVLYLESSDEVLVKRYKETRRSHPLAKDGRLIKGIQEERRILQDIKKRASYIIDTTNLTTRQLKEEINNIFIEGSNFPGLIINIMSFGFKYGIPTESDLVFDVRFIPNPYYISSMKMLTGKDETVKEFVLESKETIDFMIKLNEMLEFLIPNYIKEGKSQLVVSIGCTGGKHRSVAISDKIFTILKEKGHRAVVEHRDIEKDNRNMNK